MGVRGGREATPMARKRKRVPLARSLRQNDVPAEALLWKALRNRALEGFKFRRQHIIEPYVLDFACVACRLAVELDGETHVSSKIRDAKRDQFLEARGWKVLRFWNPEIYEDLETVKETIYEACARRSNRS